MPSDIFIYTNPHIYIYTGLAPLSVWLRLGVTIIYRKLTSTPPKRSNVYVLGEIDCSGVLRSSVTNDMASIDSNDDSSCTTTEWLDICSQNVQTGIKGSPQINRGVLHTMTMLWMLERSLLGWLLSWSLLSNAGIPYHLTLLSLSSSRATGTWKTQS